MKNINQSDSQSIRSKASANRVLLTRAKQQPNDSKSKAGSQTSKKSKSREIQQKSNDYITPTPDGDDQNQKKKTVRTEQQLVSRFLRATKEKAHKDDEEDLHNQVLQVVNLKDTELERVNFYNVPNELRPDGRQKHYPRQNKKNAGKIEDEQYELERQKKVEQYYVPGKTNIYEDQDRIQFLKQQALAMFEQIDASELQFEEVHHEDDDQHQQLKIPYQLSAFVNESQVNAQQRQQPRMSIDFSVIGNNQEEKEIEVDLELSQDVIQDDSIQQFQKCAKKEKVLVTSNLAIVQERENGKLLEDEQDEERFTIPASKYIPLVKNKERISNMFEQSFDQTRMSQAVMEELVPFNEEKINNLTMKISQEPIILEPFKRLNFQTLDIYKSLDKEDIKAAMFKMMSITKINQRLHKIYLDIFNTISCLQQITQYLNEELDQIDAQIKQTMNEYQNIWKEIAKFTIISMKKDILESDRPLQLKNQALQIMQQMQVNVKRINKNIGLVEQQHIVTQEINFDQILLLVKENKTEFYNQVNQFEQKFNFYVYSESKCQLFQTFLRSIIFFSFILDLFNNQLHGGTFQMEQDFFDFLLNYPDLYQSQKQKLQDLTYHIFKLLINYQQTQEEQIKNARKLLENFENGYNSYLILCDFEKVKLKKLETKIQTIKIGFNSILIPFSENKEYNINQVIQYTKKIKNLISKKETLLKELIQMAFTPESSQQLNNSKGRQLIFFEYLGFRNSIIRNPKKFNYNFLLQRPMFLLQQLKQFINIERLMNNCFYSMQQVLSMFIFYNQIQKVEETLFFLQELRGHIRNHVGQTDNQIIIRTQVKDLQGSRQQILSILLKFPAIEKNLPQQFIRIKEWIILERNQMDHILDVLYQQVKIPNEKFMKQIVSGDLSNVLEIVPQSQKLIEQIRKIIQIEPAPPVLGQIKSKILTKGKVQTLGIPLTRDQEKALIQIFCKYLDEDEEKKLSAGQKFNIQEESDKLLTELVLVRDQAQLELEQKTQVVESYLQLAEMSQSYNIWEHIVASRYLVDPQLMIETIKSVELVENDDKVRTQYTLEILIRKVKEQSSSILILLNRQLTFFEINQNISIGVLLKKHIQDCYNFLMLIKINFDQFKDLTQKNIENPGTVNCDAIMQEVNQKLSQFFKRKDNTLLIYKDELLKGSKIYLSNSNNQFKNSVKQVILDAYFKDYRPFIQKCENQFKQAIAELKIIYDKSYVEVMQLDQDYNIKIVYIQMSDQFPIIGEVLLLRNQNEKYIEELNQFKKENDLSTMTTYEGLVSDYLQLLSDIGIYVNLFEKTVFLEYKNTGEFVNKLIQLIDQMEIQLSSEMTSGLLQQIAFFKQGYEQALNEQREILFQSPGKRVNGSKFKQYEAIEEFCQLNFLVGETAIQFLESINQFLTQFKEICDGFNKYSEQIDLQTLDFFHYVNTWLYFYNEIQQVGKSYGEKKTAQQLLEQMNQLIGKIPDNIREIKRQMKEIFDRLKMIGQDYEKKFDAMFMQHLSTFGREYHEGSQKVQDFQAFAKDLLYYLTPTSSDKQAVRKALMRFYEKNKKSEEPLRRMNQFLKAIVQIQQDPRMKRQKCLNMILNLGDIHDKMGGGNLESWIQMCKLMQNALTDFLNDNQSGQLKEKGTYTQKVIDNVMNVNDDELRKMVEKFIGLLNSDYDLSRY